MGQIEDELLERKQIIENMKKEKEKLTNDISLLIEEKERSEKRNIESLEKKNRAQDEIKAKIIEIGHALEEKRKILRTIQEKVSETNFQIQQQKVYFNELEIKRDRSKNRAQSSIYAFQHDNDDNEEEDNESILLNLNSH